MRRRGMVFVISVVLAAEASAGCAPLPSEAYDAHPGDGEPSAGDGIAAGDPALGGDAALGHDPVLFVHGVRGSADNFATMIGRFVADGWPADRLFAYTFSDPQWGCNADNADTIAAWIDAILASTGALAVDLVAHSMGSLSSRAFMKNLGGHDRVHTYVTLGGMHHGLLLPCLSPAGMQCTWDELCASRDFLTQLNQDPVTPGPALWVSMYGSADTTVPNSSSELAGAENIAFAGVEHSGTNGLTEVEAVYLEVRRVLEY